MVAVDTNVLIRLITKDEPIQAQRATKLFEREQIWIAKTVLLESEWVLRSLYRFASQDVGDAFKRLGGLSNVYLEDSTAVAQAIEWLEAGVDFADAIHLASCGEAKSFATFDKNFAKQTTRLSIGVRLL